MSQHCESTELTATATCTGEQDASAHREWALVCVSADLPACVTGWEFPGQREAADAGRFEVIWSVDPQMVSSTAAICAQLARSARSRPRTPTGDPAV